MQKAELEARIRRAVRRWKTGDDPQDANLLIAELIAELADVTDPHHQPPADPDRPRQLGPEAPLHRNGSPDGRVVSISPAR